MNTYEINNRNEVIPYTSGRKCTDTRAWRDASELELQQQDQIKTLETELTAAREELAELKEEYGTWLAQKRIAIDDLVELSEQRDRARREAEQWRDCLKIGMSMQVKSPSQIFPWEKKSTEP